MQRSVSIIVFFIDKHFKVISFGTLISEIRASTLLDLFFSYLALQKVTLSILPTHFTKHPTAVDLF